MLASCSKSSWPMFFSAEDGYQHIFLHKFFYTINSLKHIYIEKQRVQGQLAIMFSYYMWGRPWFNVIVVNYNLKCNIISNWT